MKQISFNPSEFSLVGAITFLIDGCSESESDEIIAFVEMCRSRKLDPADEMRKAIQARYDAMLAE